MIARTIIKTIQEEFFQKKAIVILGARQVGKSTLLKNLLQNQSHVLWLDAENPDVSLIFENANATRLKSFFGDNTFVVIDEAQKIPDIGSKLKLITDHLPEIQVIATGSSAFELRNQLNEPLTGRKFEHKLFPISFIEMKNEIGLLEEIRMLPHRLVFGYYPEIVTTKNNPEKILRLVSDSYLYKDVLLFKGIRKPEKMQELLKALAWQIGSEVNYNELGKMIGLKSETVEDYIHLLEQSFVIYRLNSFHSNQRTEIKKGKKVYFNDLGIRNAIINDFSPFETRKDKGNLFENYVINELIKSSEYNERFEKFYFWRSQEQQEIDLIIEKNGQLRTFEIKWNAKTKAKLTKTFANQYPNHTFTVINSNNFYDYLD
ncbi:ATP-binding protein [Flavobacterium sp.]|jgi:predicted AAA+ superfamily ATPase|uniref:ATP-binding protein n=1 Tax=Flavobacterium sp. TaxID=239 RepID=UPI0022CBF567|nr:ATP-binding protein [Flavobacterium sp.]MCZ8228343.1 ATP-binding protein [Flavobacterium sp.]